MGQDNMKGTAGSKVSPAAYDCPHCGQDLRPEPDAYDELLAYKSGMRRLDACNRALESALVTMRNERDTAIEEIKRLASFPHPDVGRFIKSNREWAASYVKQRTRAEKAEAEVEWLKEVAFMHGCEDVSNCGLVRGRGGHESGEGEATPKAVSGKGPSVVSNAAVNPTTPRRRRRGDRERGVTGIKEAVE